MGIGRKLKKALKTAVNPIGELNQKAGEAIGITGPANQLINPLGAVSSLPTKNKLLSTLVNPIGSLTQAAGKRLGVSGMANQALNPTGSVANMLSPAAGEFSSNTGQIGDDYMMSYDGLAPSLSEIYATPATPMSTEGMELPTFTQQEAFSFDPSQFAESPAYKFAMDEMINATNRAAAARGKTHSGNVLAELQNRAAGLASMGYGDEFARQMQQYGVNQNTNLLNYNIPYQRAQDVYGRGQTQMNWLANLAGYGQNANTLAAGAGQNMANAIGGYQMANAANIGNAAGNKYGAINNAIQGGLQNYLTYNQNQNMMNSYLYPTAYTGDAYMPAYGRY